MRILLLLILIINPLVSASELTTNANNSGTVTFTYNNGNTGYAYNSTGDKFLLAGHQGSHYAEYHNHRSHMKYDLTLLTGKKIRNATFSIKARTGFLRGGHSEYGPTYNIMLNQIENFDKLTWDPKLIEIINPKFVPHNSTGYGGLFKQNITKQLQKAIDNKEPYFALQMKSSYESTDNLYGSYESFENYPSISYTLNNLPEIEFISLQENQTIGRTKDINWTSQDKDKDNLNFSLYYSTEKGKKQHLIADTTRNQQLWAFENILTGEYYLTLTAKDGFDETINSIKITIDNTPPDTIAKYPEDLDNDELIINLTALDENSEIESIYYKIDDQNWVKGNQITIKKTGTHKINYYSEDIFGNKEKEKSIIIIKEKPKIIKPEIIPPRARGYFKPIVQSIDKKQLQARIQKLNKIVQNYTKNKVYLKPEKLEKILNLQNEVNDTKLIRQVDNYVKKLKLDDINIVKTKTQKGKLYTRTIELVEKKRPTPSN